MIVIVCKMGSQIQLVLHFVLCGNYNNFMISTSTKYSVNAFTCFTIVNSVTVVNVAQDGLLLLHQIQHYSCSALLGSLALDRGICSEC